MRSIIAILLTFTAITLPLSAFAKSYGAKICHESQYSCYKVKRGENWKKLFPDEEKRNLVMRINRMNTSLYSGLTIAIPNSDNQDVLDYSPLPNNIDPPGRKLILVSLSKLAFGAYNADGSLVHWGPISSARGYCPDINRRCRTSTGVFEIQSKKGRGCVSTRYPVGRGGAPMPYCMFFNGNYALHGSYKVPGYNDSHGCVRLFVDDARWLNQEFTAGGRTKVKVY